MYREHVCTKKDKRLLVLLALGVLVLFSDVVMGAKLGSKTDRNDSAWLEVKDSTSKLYRLELTGQNLETSLGNLVNGTEKIPLVTGEEILTRLKPGRALALKNIHENNMKTVTASPKLSFFLGFPFSINDADIDDLTLIHGVGPALATKIIAYRHENGPISNPKQLERVHGIGPKMTKRIQNFITFANDGE